MIDTNEQVKELTPYENEYRRNLKDEEQEDLNLSDFSEETTQEDEGLVAKKQEHDWKKRYSDLKSYHDRKNNEWEQEKELLEAKSKLAEQANTFSSAPKTTEELKEFEENYPDVFGVVQTVSQLQADARTKELEDRIAQLQKQEEQAQYKTAEQELLVLHPDFNELKEDTEFLDWLDKQPSVLSDGIYNNRTDARWAARVIDLYKADTGINQKTKASSKDAAAVVTKSTKTAPFSKNDGKKIWSIEEISRLKPHEFEQLESEIDAAKREGRIQ
jgi:hypothetical protein